MICWASVPASVTTPSACVSPRVNSTEPCTRGSTPTSIVIGRMSSGLRPSARTPWSRIDSRSPFLTSLPMISPTFLLWALASASSIEAGAAKSASAADLAALMAACRTCLMPSVSGAWRSALPCAFSILASSLVSATGASNSIFGLPAFSASSSTISTICLMTSCASARASSTTSSFTSLAPASTMTTASEWPATVRLSLFSSLWSWVQVGFTTSSPSTWPMRTMPSERPCGSELTASAAKLAIAARMSPSFSRSLAMHCDSTCTSRRKPSGNIGRIERSMIRQVRISLVFGRPSRLKKPPGMMPAADIFSR